MQTIKQRTALKAALDTGLINHVQYERMVNRPGVVRKAIRTIINRWNPLFNEANRRFLVKEDIYE